MKRENGVACEATGRIVRARETIDVRATRQNPCPYHARVSAQTQQSLECVESARRHAPRESSHILYSSTRPPLPPPPAARVRAPAADATPGHTPHTAPSYAARGVVHECQRPQSPILVPPLSIGVVHAWVGQIVQFFAYSPPSRPWAPLRLPSPGGSPTLLGAALGHSGKSLRQSAGGWFHGWLAQNVDKTFVREKNETGARVNAARLEYTHGT